MKVILSRKGFDSQYGGYPSPILPNGRMISLPIPSNDNLTYNDLRVNNKQSYFELMLLLNPRIRLNRNWQKLENGIICHLDPDINESVIKRDNSWKPLFGQINASQSHLSNHQVKEGDLFLFFGTFRKVDDKYKYTSTPEIHAFYGYFQIGEIKEINKNSSIPAWMKYHPHTNPKRFGGNNTIYIAREKLKWRSDMPGANVFKFSNKLVLTKPGHSKSKWELPPYFKDLNISYHSDKSWKNDYFQSASRGQEFVIQESLNVEKWAMDMIESKN